MVTSPFLVSIEWRIVARLVARIRTLNPDVQPLPKILQGQIIQKQQDHLHLQKSESPFGSNLCRWIVAQRLHSGTARRCLFARGGQCTLRSWHAQIA